MSIKKALVALTLSAGLLQAQAHANTRILFNIQFPQNHLFWTVLTDWAEEVKTASNGELLIEFPSQSVSPPDRTVDAVRSGVADAGMIFNGFIADSTPGLMLSQMPWIHHGDTRAMSVAAWETYQQYFADKEQMRGVKLVSLFHLGPSYLCQVTNKPLESAADMREQRIWTLPGTIAQIYSNMDMAIIAGPAVQSHELVSRNTVDSHHGHTLETIVDFRVAPYTRSCFDVLPAMQSASFSVFFNQRFWDRLSDEHRTLLEQTTGATMAAAMGELANERDAQSRLILDDEGVVFKPANPQLLEAVRDSAADIEAKWIESVARYGVDGNEVLNTVRERVRELSAL